MKNTDTIRHDLRSAFRNLTSSPGFAAIAILSLAVGIGATTTVFSLINTIAWKPLPYHDAKQLTDVSVNNPLKVCDGCGVGGSYADYLDWRSRSRVFSQMAAYNEIFSSVATADGGVRTRVALVTASAFPLLGVEPIRGRTFGEAEDRIAAPHVAVISERMWDTRFHREPSVVGQNIRIDGIEHTIIGIMPKRFAFPYSAEVWAPLAPVASPMREQRDIGIVGRIASGRSLSDAQVEMALIAKQLQREHPVENGGWNAFVEPLRSDLSADYVGMMPVMLGAVFFVLLIACANLGSLLLARAVGRRRELAVRAALGAARSALMRQLMTESLLVAAIGGALGLLLAAWGLSLMRYTGGESWPQWMEFTIDWRVAAFAVAVSVGAALAFGLMPALRASHPDVSEVLKDAGRSGLDGKGARRIRNVLVIGELSLALVLLACAGLFARAAVRTSRVDMGFDPNHMVRADVAPPASHYTTREQRVALADALSQRVHQIPGVTDAAFSTLYVRAWPGTPAGTPRLDGASDDSLASDLISHVNNVTPEYFDAYGMKMRAGRAFTDADRAGAPLVAIVSGDFAERAWPDGSAVGRRIRIGAAGDDPWRTVVGVIDNVSRSAFGRGRRAMMYLPYAQFPESQPSEFGLEMTLRTSVAEGDVISQVRPAIAAVDKDATIDQLMSMKALHARNSSGTRSTAWIASSLALFAMLLASIGIYSVVAFGVSQRKHEIGVRMALGAHPAEVKWMIVRQAMRLTATGLAIGIPIALAAATFIRSMLFNAQPYDVAVYAAVILFFVLVTLVAAWLPARRAAHVDPLVALRAD